MRSSLLGRPACCVAATLVAIPVASGQCGFPFGENLTPSDPAVAGQYGFSVALAGDIAVVGAPFATNEAGMAVGAAYVFRSNGTNFVEEAILMATDMRSGDQFGFSVAVSEQRIVVGAPFDDEGLTNAGSAYIFEYNTFTSMWTEVTKLTANSPGSEDWFGYSVSISGDAVAVGAPLRDSPPDGGAVIAFRRSPTLQTWAQEAELRPNGIASADTFGWSVSISGDRLVGGSPLDDPLAGLNAGSAYVFQHVSGAWQFERTLAASSGEAGDQFGRSVSINGSRVIVGAPFDDDPGLSNIGSAHSFERFATGSWSAATRHVTPTPAAEDHFGASVFMFGEQFVVGAPYRDTPAGADAGAAWVFARNAGQWVLADSLLAANGAPGALFGSAVALTYMHALASFTQPEVAVALFNAEPRILCQPLDQVEEAGAEHATFTVVTTGSCPTTYQWRRDGMILTDGLSGSGSTISGSGTPCLIIFRPGQSDKGAYACNISDICGVIQSDAATLVVRTKPCAADLNDNGTIDFGDITYVLERWLTECR